MANARDFTDVKTAWQLPGPFWERVIFQDRAVDGYAAGASTDPYPSGRGPADGPTPTRPKSVRQASNRCVDAYWYAYEAFFEFFERLRYASGTLKGRLVDASGTLIFKVEICNYFSGSSLRI